MKSPIGKIDAEGHTSAPAAPASAPERRSDPRDAAQHNAEPGGAEQLMPFAKVIDSVTKEIADIDLTEQMATRLANGLRTGGKGSADNAELHNEGGPARRGTDEEHLNRVRRLSAQTAASGEKQSARENSYLNRHNQFRLATVKTSAAQIPSDITAVIFPRFVEIINGWSRNPNVLATVLALAKNNLADTPKA